MSESTYTRNSNEINLQTDAEEISEIYQFCQNSAAQIGNLMNLERRYSEERPYKCHLCQKSFEQAINLEEHMGMHTGEKPHKCLVCQKSFGQFSLKEHMRIHTGEKPYKCLVCQKSFSQSSHLKVHMRTHTGEKPHECQLCENSFACVTSLKNHMRTHTGEKPFKCQLCQKSFALVSQLNIHMRTHTGEKPYKCQLCQNSFACGSTLRNHLRTHTAEMPHKCNFCGKSFVRVTEMMHHMSIHSGENPHICPLWQKGFSHSDGLRNHLKTHVSTKSSVVEVCPEVFKDPRNLICKKLFTESNTRTKQFSFHSDVQPQDLKLNRNVIVDNSDQCRSLSNSSAVEGNECFTKKLVHDGNEIAGLPKTVGAGECFIIVNRSKSIEDVKPFLAEPYGCGLCNELFEIEKEFLEHCSGHGFAPADDLFLDLFLTIFCPGLRVTKTGKSISVSN